MKRDNSPYSTWRLVKAFIISLIGGIACAAIIIAVIYLAYHGMGKK